MKRFINNYILLGHLHLQSRLFCLSLLIILPIFAVAIVTYKSAERTIEKNASEYTASMLEQAINSVDLYIENADGVLQSILFDRNLTRRIYNSQKSEYDRTVEMSEVKKILNGYIYPNKYIGQIYIVDHHNSIFASSSMMLEILKEEEWFNDFYEGDDKVALIPTHNASSYIVRLNDNIDTVITILRKYTNIDKNEDLGVIGIDISYQYISNIFRNSEVDNDTATMLITEQGKVVYNSDKTLVGTTVAYNMYQQIFDNKSGSFVEKINNISHFIVYTTSEKTNWKLVQLIPVDRLFSEAKSIRRNTFLVGVICTFLALLISVGASYSVSAPIKKLRRVMAKVEKGDLNVQMEISSGDEIGELSNSFNRMIEELKTSIQKIYEDENLKKQIELNMLQQQINPHFLFNTLDSINWMARMQNAPNISFVINSLVKLLQASTYTNRDFVTIGEEIENSKNYIAIQKFRYGSLFDVTYDIDEAIITNYTLKLILQPLIENAIYHGFEDKVEGGSIIIGGKIIENVIHLWVEDNGKGIDQDKIELILLKDIKESSRYSSIGISNTAKRIKLYYGEAYGLEIKRLEMGGTKAMITIPVRLAERMKLDDQSDSCR